MPSLTKLALISLATVGSLAGPVSRRSTSYYHDSKCLSKTDAQQVADNFVELIRAYSDDLALASLAEDFTDYSESIKSLINACPQDSAAKPLPLLSPSYTSREEFLIGQSQQPSVNLEQLGIWYDCNSVIIRWQSSNTAPIPHPLPVVGIIVMEVEKAATANKYPWLINTVYSEFDSIAWLQNLEEWGICKHDNEYSPKGSIPAYSAAPSTTVTYYSSTPASTYAPVSYTYYDAASYSTTASYSYSSPAAYSTPPSYSYSGPAASYSTVPSYTAEASYSAPASSSTAASYYTPASYSTKASYVPRARRDAASPSPLPNHITIPKVNEVSG